MALDPHDLPQEAVDFLAERHLGSLTTLRADGSPHVVAIGFAYSRAEQVVRVITSASSRKAVNAGCPGARAAVAQVDGARWLSLEGPVTVSSAPDRVAAAEAAYAGRYGTPGPNPERVALEITVERILGRG